MCVTNVVQVLHSHFLPVTCKISTILLPIIQGGNRHSLGKQLILKDTLGDAELNSETTHVGG